MVDLTPIFSRIRKNPGFERVGMILSHVGIVRAFSRKGKQVKKVLVRIDKKRLEEIINEAREKKGIISVEVIVFEGERKIGEPLMVLVVAGDFRENVIRVLEKTLDRIKSEATYKEEVETEESNGWEKEGLKEAEQGHTS